MKCLHKISRYIASKEDLHFGKVSTWIEYCGLHKVGRVLVTLLDKFSIGGHLYSMEKVLLMRKPWQKLRTSMESLMRERLQVNGNYLPPSEHRLKMLASFK